MRSTERFASLLKKEAFVREHITERKQDTEEVKLVRKNKGKTKGQKVLPPVFFCVKWKQLHELERTSLRRKDFADITVLRRNQIKCSSKKTKQHQFLNKFWCNSANVRTKQVFHSVTILPC